MLLKTKEDLVDIKQKINQAASNNATFQVWDKMIMTEIGKQRCLRRVGHVCADQGRNREGRVWREVIVSVLGAIHYQSIYLPTHWSAYLPTHLPGRFNKASTTSLGRF